jgi:hypothetical protein
LGPQLGLFVPLLERLEAPTNFEPPELAFTAPIKPEFIEAVRLSNVPKYVAQINIQFCHFLN